MSLIRRPKRVYADTSVFGGVFDKEFSIESRKFFEEVISERFRLVVSPLIEQELLGAPEDVRVFFEEISRLTEIVLLTNEARALRDAYISAGIVSRKSLTDAFHVAIATVAECRAIVTWNFRHIVHFDKIPL